MNLALNCYRTMPSISTVLAISTLAMNANARAADHFDMAQLTCGELARTYGNEFAVIDAWLSGYFHGKLDKTAVDSNLILERAAKVVGFCKANPNVTAIKAVEQLITEVNAMPATPAK